MSRSRLVAIVLFAVAQLLGLLAVGWAGSFAEVPSGHWAYAACRRLAAQQLLSSDGTGSFSGNPRLTRFEFGVTILPLLAEVDRAVSSLGPAPAANDVAAAATLALDTDPDRPEADLGRAATDLRRLAVEFADVLRAFSFDSTRTLAALQALTPEPGAKKEALLPRRRGRMALSYGSDTRALMLLDSMALASSGTRGSIGSPGMATAFADGGRPESASAEPGIRDPLVSRMRTAYEYGLGSALTLSLAYEGIARRGQGMAPLDSASLASFGIGYRLTPSAYVKLSYSVLEYSNHVLDSPPLRDRVAETAVSIGF